MVPPLVAYLRFAPHSGSRSLRSSRSPTALMWPASFSSPPRQGRVRAAPAETASSARPSPTPGVARQGRRSDDVVCCPPAPGPRHAIAPARHARVSGLFQELLPCIPSWHRSRKIFHNANDGIRCDAEYRGMCYALNENVCKNAPPSSLRRVHAYVCATIPIARHNKHGHLSRKESQNDRNHRTEVSCHGGTIRRRDS